MNERLTECITKHRNTAIFYETKVQTSLIKVQTKSQPLATERFIITGDFHETVNST